MLNLVLTIQCMVKFLLTLFTPPHPHTALPPTSQGWGGGGGPNNPMYGQYGKVPANAMTIYVYSLDNKLVRSFTSQVAAAEWLGVSNVTVHNYIRYCKVFKGIYRLSIFLLFLFFIYVLEFFFYLFDYYV